jgi:hypothetical protein
MSYVADPNSPSGYTLTTNLSAPEQQLFNTTTGTQAITGQTARNLAGNVAGMYSTPFDPQAASKSTTDLLNQWTGNYLSPIFQQQQSNTDAALRNQGLAPGSEAYNNAQNLLARNQGAVTNQYLAGNQQQAFNQAVQAYGIPMQTIGSLFGMSTPQGPTMLNTPTAQIQPANYMGAAEQNYQQQSQNYQNLWNNIGKLGVGAASLAMAPMTGGLSLAGGLGSMFGGSPTGSPGYGNFGQYSPYSPMNQYG